MPKGTRVHRCVDKLKQDHEIGSAIAICQNSTAQGYQSGKPLKSLKALRNKYGKKTISSPSLKGLKKKKGSKCCATKTCKCSSCGG